MCWSLSLANVRVCWRMGWAQEPLEQVAGICSGHWTALLWWTMLGPAAQGECSGQLYISQKQHINGIQWPYERKICVLLIALSNTERPLRLTLLKKLPACQLTWLWKANTHNFISLENQNHLAWGFFFFKTKKVKEKTSKNYRITSYPGHNLSSSGVFLSLILTFQNLLSPP